MLKQTKTLSALMLLLAAMTFSACETEDPGPLQVYEKEFSLIDFDRLEMGSAFNIQVVQSANFSIHAKGDRRNIDDLKVFKSGKTLIIKFDEYANRIHETYITIKMHSLEAINFSGASASNIKGFGSDENLDLYLSGASVCQLSADYREINLILSGASSLLLNGQGDELSAEISGASLLKAFDYPVQQASVSLSGGSIGKVSVADELNAVATGASSLLYYGNPAVTSNVSGASVVQQD